MIELNKSDLAEINKTFVKLSTIDKHKAFKEFTSKVYKDSIRNADKHTKTGAMVQSIFLQQQGTSYYVGADSTIAPYAIFVHWGTKKHKIERKNKKALRFTRGGVFAFSKFVNHPGYEGDPFILHALNDNIKKLPALFNKITKDL